MAKYRLLSLEELQELEKEFVDYLIINGIVADDWGKIKNEDPEKALKIIDLFSDVVFEQILQNTQFLEFREKTKIETVQCLKDKFVVVGLEGMNVKGLDFNDSEDLKKYINDPPENLRIYTTEIPYQESRELEIFKKINQEFLISDGALFKSICLVLPQ